MYIYIYIYIPRNPLERGASAASGADPGSGVGERSRGFGRFSFAPAGGKAELWLPPVLRCTNSKFWRIHCDTPVEFWWNSGEF